MIKPFFEALRLAISDRIGVAATRDYRYNLIAVD